MPSRWKRWGAEVIAWFIGPGLAWGLVTALAGLIGGLLTGLPAVVIGLIVLLALTAGVGLAHLGLSFYERLRSIRKPPPELKSEIATIQRELVRHENRRQGNGGSIWPIERPFRDLPTDQWMAHGSRLRLPAPDQQALSTAYELAARFNNEMLAGEMTIMAANEPDLAGLRSAFDDAAAAVGLPPAPSPGSPAGGGEFGRRDDPGALAQRCHMLAGSVARWVESFNRGHSERAERMVEEWMGADPATGEAEARRRAYTRDEKNWEADYRLKYEAEAKKLFDEAYEMGEIAKEHERLAVAPLAIEFESVPRLFNEIAARLYGEAA